MTSNTKLEEKLEGVDNFRAWKYKVMLILEENDLEGFIKEEVPEPDEDKAKEKNKNMVKENRIIADSIKDHLIPHDSVDAQKRNIKFFPANGLQCIITYIFFK